MKMVLASRNRKKIREMQFNLEQYLPGIEILSLDDIGFTGEIEENGATFEENAICKASVPASLGYIGIADDSGLCVDALNGEPGIYSARYADGEGEGHDDGRNNAKVLRLLKGVPEEKRTARYVSAIACVTPEGETFTVRGECEGRILETMVGEGGFGYDPMFYFPPFDCTFGQIPLDRKNEVSHRGKAMRLFAEECKKRFGTDK